jgi:hypothetical protein
MRKLLLLATLVIGMITVAQAQDIYYAYGISRGEWNTYHKRWDWGPEKAIELRFTIQSNTILVSDKAGSTYKLGRQTIDEDTEEIQQHGWIAVDESNRRCTVKLLKRKSSNNIEIYVVYPETAFVYYLER